MEPFYPLHIFVCESCYLVQLDEYVSPDHIFTEYAYFSSYADSWVEHAKQYVDAVTDRFGLNRFQFRRGACQQRWVPADSTSCRRAFRSSASSPPPMSRRWRLRKGIPDAREFFGVKTARRLPPEGAMLT